MGAVAIILLSIIALAVIGRAGREVVVGILVLGLIAGGYALLMALFGGLLFASI